MLFTFVNLDKSKDVALYAYPTPVILDILVKLPKSIDPEYSLSSLKVISRSPSLL